MKKAVVNMVDVVGVAVTELETQGTPKYDHPSDRDYLDIARESAGKAPAGPSGCSVAAILASLAFVPPAQSGPAGQGSSGRP
jgi:hypothetical protein